MYRQSVDFWRLRFSGMGEGSGTAASNMASQGDESESDTF